MRGLHETDRCFESVLVRQSNEDRSKLIGRSHVSLFSLLFLFFWASFNGIQDFHTTQKNCRVLWVGSPQSKEHSWTPAQFGFVPNLSSNSLCSISSWSSIFTISWLIRATQATREFYLSSFDIVVTTSMFNLVILKPNANIVRFEKNLV